MSAAVPTDAEIRDACWNLAAELRSLVGTGTVPAEVTARLPWCRSLACLDVFGVDYLTTALGYLLAHRLSRDLAATQGSTSAQIGPGVTGAITSVATGGMSLGYGASGMMGPAVAGGAVDAELALSVYGQGFLALRNTRPIAIAPFCG